MEQDPNIVQDALNRIGQESGTPDPQDPSADPNNPGVELTPEQQAQQKANQAFAAMRTENKALAEKLAALEEQLKLAQTNPEPQPKSVPDADPTPQPNNEALVKIQELEQRLSQYETQRTEEQERTARDRAVQGLVTVRNEFNLDEAGLTKFVQDAERAGYDLIHTSMPLRQIYTGLYYDTLVKSEVERIQAEITAANAPGTGPSGTAPSSRAGDSTSRARLQAVVDKYLPKE